MKYLMQYREPGKRPGKTRWAWRPVASVWDAIQFTKENPEALPVTVTTKGWKRTTVAFIG